MFLKLTAIFVILLLWLLVFKYKDLIILFSFIYVVGIFPLSFAEVYSEDRIIINSLNEINKHVIYFNDESLHFTDLRFKNLLKSNNYVIIKIIEKNIWGDKVPGSRIKYVLEIKNKN